MKIYYLKNKIDNEIVDILANSLENAKKKAAKVLGGNTCNYVERFSK